MGNADPRGGHKRGTGERWRPWSHPYVMIARHRATVIAAVKAKATGQETGTCSDPFGFAGNGHSAEQHTIGPILPIGDHIHAVVDAIADVDIKSPWITKEGFVLR